jgi:hypothetical protein
MADERVQSGAKSHNFRLPARFRSSYYRIRVAQKEG